MLLPLLFLSLAVADSDAPTPKQETKCLSDDGRIYRAVSYKIFNDSEKVASSKWGWREEENIVALKGVKAVDEAPGSMSDYEIFHVDLTSTDIHNRALPQGETVEGYVVCWKQEFKTRNFQICRNPSNSMVRITKTNGGVTWFFGGSLVQNFIEKLTPVTAARAHLNSLVLKEHVSNRDEVRDTGSTLFLRDYVKKMTLRAPGLDRTALFLCQDFQLTNRWQGR